MPRKTRDWDNMARSCMNINLVVNFKNDFMVMVMNSSYLKVHPRIVTLKCDMWHSYGLRRLECYIYWIISHENEQKARLKVLNIAYKNRPTVSKLKFDQHTKYYKNRNKISTRSLPSNFIQMKPANQILSGLHDQQQENILIGEKIKKKNWNQTVS